MNVGFLEQLTHEPAKNSKKMKRIIFIAAFALVGLIVVAAAIMYWKRDQWAPAFGGSNISVQLTDTAHYQQNDPRWGNLRLGSANAETLAKAGCTISSVAMAMTNLGVPYDPGQLSTALTAEDGFTPQGLLKWDGISRVTKGKVRVDVHSAPSLDKLDACLARGDYPIVKFLIGGVIPHWVVLVGKHNGTYSMRDPLIDEPAPSPLTRRTPVILSVRCIGLAQTSQAAVAGEHPHKINLDTSPEHTSLARRRRCCHTLYLGANTI
jgi:hypothetical protein